MEVSWSSHFKKWNQHLPYLSAFFVDFLFSLLSIPNSSKSVKVETWIINRRNISKFADFGRRTRQNSQKAKVKILISMIRGQKRLLQIRIIHRIPPIFYSTDFLSKLPGFNCLFFDIVSYFWDLAWHLGGDGRQGDRNSDSWTRDHLCRKEERFTRKNTRNACSRGSRRFDPGLRISFGKIENTVFCR